MRNFLQVWLMLGLLLPAFPAFAEEPPTKAELDRLKTWNDLFLSPSPVFQDSEKQFIQHRYFSREESRARDAFFRLPQTKALVEEGRKEISAFIDKATSDAAKAYPALGREISLDPGSEPLLSFQQFWQQNSRQKSTMTEAEAERLARYQLEQRYGRLDLQDFNQRREFQRETNRFLMSSEGRKTSPRFTETDFNEWRLSEIQRMKRAREANMQSLARLTLELSPGTLQVGKALPDGTISRESLMMISPKDLEGATFHYRPIQLSVRDTLTLESQKRAAVSWYVRLKSGEEFGIDGASGSHVQRKFPNSAFSDFSVNDLFRAPAGRKEKLLAYFAAANAEDCYSELEEKVAKELRFRPDPKEVEALIARATHRFETLQDSLKGLIRWEGDVLFARGLLKDPDFWKKRDAQAKALGLGKFPLGKDDAPKVGLFSGGSRYGKEEGGGLFSFSSGPRSSVSLSGAPMRAENTAKEVLEESAKNILFKTNKIIPIRGPDFYSLFDTTKAAEAEEIASLPGKSSLSVSTAQPFQPRAGLVVIPTPADHSLTSLELTDAGGNKLEAGRDFKVLKGKDGYALQMQASDSLYRFRAGFKPVAAGNPPEFPSFDKARLARIRDDLARAKLNALAGGLDDLLKKEKVSIRDLEALFKNGSLYSYNSEPNIPANVKAASGPFADYARFVDAEGRACFQCDGSNSLFKQVLEEYFGGKAKVRNVAGFVAPYRNLREDRLHLITKVEVEGFAPLTLDATPVKLEKERALPGQAERVVAQSTKVYSEPPRPKPVYVENFRRELADSKAKFLKVAEPVRLNFNKGDPWLNVGKATAVLDDYLEGGRTLEEAGEELKKFFPGRSIEFGSHDDLMRSLSALAREERATLAKAVSFAKENPHIPGGGGYTNSAVVATTDRRLEILAKAEELVNSENFGEYRAARAPVAGGCSEMFGVLAK
jgi:hypothetical protein